jgi:hypothetical protein
MPEWSIGAVSKTVVPFGVPRVRIPLSPQIRKSAPEGAFLFWRNGQISFELFRKNKNEKAKPALFMILASPVWDHAVIPLSLQKKMNPRPTKPGKGFIFFCRDSTKRDICNRPNFKQKP